MSKVLGKILGLAVSFVLVAGVAFAADATDASKTATGEAAKKAIQNREEATKKTMKSREEEAAKKKEEAAKKKVEPIDINSASEEQLKALPGVGDAYAKKIVEGRPYANKSQLKSKKVVPADVYDKISGSIVAKQPKKK